MSLKIGILGTGMVGTTIGTKLASADHPVMLGSRTRDNPRAIAWAQSIGKNASNGTFREAASFGEMLFNCTAGKASLEALHAAQRENLAGKILVDVANPLDSSQGSPPILAVCNTDSIAEQIQRAFPDTKVVKSLNTMNCVVMVNPQSVPGNHNVFLSGNDPDAKAQVSKLLENTLGWRTEQIMDLGDITTARGVEMVLPLWIRLYMNRRRPDFNFLIASAEN